MGSIKLTRSAKYHLYTIDVSYLNNSQPCPFTAIIDTGSEKSSINEATAKKLGISKDGLPRRDYAGVGGSISSPVIESFRLWFMAEGELKNVALREVAIHDPIKRKVTKKTGFTVQRGFTSYESPNILGLDFLEGLNATLVLSPGGGVSEIRW